MSFDLQMRGTPRNLPEGYIPQYEGRPEYFQVRQEGMAVLLGLVGIAGVLEPTAKPPGLWRRLVGQPASERVPIYKFLTNDEWLVTPHECRLLAAACERIEPVLTQEGIDAALKPIEERERARVAKLVAMGQTHLAKVATSPVIALDAARTWLREFGTFSRLAADCDGFTVS